MFKKGKRRERSDACRPDSVNMLVVGREKRCEGAFTPCIDRIPNSGYVTLAVPGILLILVWFCLVDVPVLFDPIGLLLLVFIRFLNLRIELARFNVGFRRRIFRPVLKFFAELFSVRVRYSGASLGYQIGAVFGGGLSPIIAAALLSWTGTSAAISTYMVLISVLAFGCVLALTETYQSDVDDVPAAGAALLAE